MQEEFTTSPRPGKAPFLGLPSALKPLAVLPCWLVWRWEKPTTGNKNKWTKVPYQARRPEAKASSTDKSTWSDYETAVEVVRTRADVDGIGFCLLGATGLAAFDLDDCRDLATGRIAPWAQALVDRCASYTEITVSGTGLRIIGHGIGPEVHKQQPTEDGGKLETYRGAKRYIVITGDALNEHELEDIDEHIDAVVAEWEQKNKTKKQKKPRAPHREGGIPRHLLALLHIPNAGEGQPTGDYPDRSAALFGFINLALRAGADEEDIVAATLDAKYAGMAIYEHVQEHGGEEYVGRQIERALNNIDDHSADAKAILRVKQGHRHEVWRAVTQALRKANCPVFVRGGSLVEPLWRWEQGDEANSGTLVAKFVRYNLWRLSDMVAKHAVSFQKYDKRKEEWHPADPPKDVIETVLQRGDWDFPTVRGIINSPTMRPDGSLLTAPGYDTVTQLWYKPASGLELPSIPERPSKAEAEEALKLLTDLLKGFPFEADVDKAVALAALFTVVVRGAFEIAPLFFFLAPESGTGKTYLVFVITTIASGRRAVPLPGTEDPQEMQKRLQAAAIEGKPILFLNNLTSDLDSSLLSQMVTDGTVDVRPFGKNDELIPCDCRGTTVFANGNNIRIVGDLVRRTLTSRINARMEQPETRTFEFDPIDKVKANRGAYLAAVFTIVRAYMAAGCPPQQEAVAFAGFDPWARMVRFPLMWLDCADPVSSTEEARAIDPERQAFRARIAAYVKHMGVGHLFNAAALVKKALDMTSGVGGYPVPAHPDLVNALSRDGRNINSKVVGNQLMNDRERVCRIDEVDYRVVLERQSDKTANTYKVEIASAPGSTASPETDPM